MSGVTQPPSYRGTKNNADVITEVLAATEKGENAKITENRAKRDSRHVYCTFWPKYTFFCVIFQNKEGRVSGFVWGGVCWGVCGGVLRGVFGVCWVCVGACAGGCVGTFVAWGWGPWVKESITRRFIIRIPW